MLLKNTISHHEKDGATRIAGLKSFRELRKSQRSADMEAMDLANELAWSTEVSLPLNEALDEETKKNKKKAKARC